METVRLDDGRHLSVRAESWPIAGGFTISRGAKRTADVVVVAISGGGALGRGECVPYAHYGETVQGVIAQVVETARALGDALDRSALNASLGPGSARNGLDCALWDHQAKTADMAVHALAGLDPPKPVATAYTIGLGAPEEMARKAGTASDYPLLKLKLGGEDDAARLRAVRASAPDARLIVDANEGWRSGELGELLRLCAGEGVELVEQPLPADADAALAAIDRPVPVCADEAVHTCADLAALRDRYDAVNIKLDKTGGLSEAIAIQAEARRLGFRIMVGCMVGTSLAMAPALLLAQAADWTDLDGPLLLERDRQPSLSYAGAVINPPVPALWG